MGLPKGWIPWNKGLTKENNSSLLAGSLKQKGILKSEAHKHKISVSQKGKLRIPREIRKCLKCSKDMMVGVTSKRKFCSKSCQTSFNKTGIRQSELTKSKRSYSLRNSEKKKEASRIFGLTHSSENHWNWRGGISDEGYGPEFDGPLKESIKDRDSFSCRICGLRSDQFVRGSWYLQIHHIDYHKKNNDTRNLITLCISCHSATNSNREYWERTLRERQDARLSIS